MRKEFARWLPYGAKRKRNGRILAKRTAGPSYIMLERPRGKFHCSASREAMQHASRTR